MNLACYYKKNIFITLMVLFLIPHNLFAFNDTISIDSSSGPVSSGTSSGEMYGSSLSTYYENGTQTVIIIGSPQFNDGVYTESGKVYIKEMLHNGAPVSSREFYKTSSNSTALNALLGPYDNFGSSIAVIGDVDGNGYSDIVVGASGYDSTHLQANNDGTVFLLLMGNNFAIQSVSQINPGSLSGTNARFGYSIANIGDIDSNGYSDIAVGAPTYNGGSGDYGRVYIMRMSASGSVISTQIIDSNNISSINGILTPASGQYSTVAGFQNAYFGASISTVGDISGNLVPDIAIGSPLAAGGEGFVNIFTLTSGGAVQTVSKIDSTNYATLGLSPIGNFGTSMSFDTSTDQLLVTSPYEVNAGIPGTYRRLALRKTYFPLTTIIRVDVLDAKKISKLSSNFPSVINSGSKFGAAILVHKDIDMNGKNDIFVSDPSDISVVGGSVFSIKQSTESIVTGTVYDTNGTTPLTNKRITLLKNNNYVGTTISNGSGMYIINGIFTNGDMITTYIDDEIENGVIIREYRGIDLTNMNIVRDAITVGDTQSQTSSYSDSILLPFSNAINDSGVSSTDFIDVLSVNSGTNTATLYGKIDFVINKISTNYSWIVSSGAVLNMPLYGEKKFTSTGSLFSVVSGGVMNHRSGVVEFTRNGNQELMGDQTYHILRFTSQALSRQITLPAQKTITILESAEFIGSPFAMVTLSGSDITHTNKAIIDALYDEKIRMNYINIIDIENSNNLQNSVILFGPTGFNSLTNSIGFLVENDADGVSNAIEDAGINGGDGNGDGVLDKDQVNVTSFPSPLSTGGVGYTTVAVNDSSIEINNLAIIPESSVTPDATSNYPVGLYDYSLQCTTTCSSLPIVIYLDTVYDTSMWRLSKYNSITGVYTDVTTITGAVFSTDTLGGLSRTKITYSISDNGPLDDDNTVGVVRDPIGPSIILNIVSNNVSLSQGSSGGGGGSKSTPLLKGFKEEILNFFPKFESALGEDSLILLQTNKQIALKAIPLSKDFVIESKIKKYSVIAVTLFRDQILLLLDKAIGSKDVLYLSYKKGSNKIYDSENRIFPSRKDILVANASDPLYSSGFAKNEFTCEPGFLRDINFVSYDKKDMTKVQTFLFDQRFLKVKPNGVYGPGTKKAIDQFQIAYKNIILTPQGFTKPNSLWGPLTRAAANALSCGQVLKK